MGWLSRYQRFWSENLDRLAAFVEEDQWLVKSNAAPADLCAEAKPSPSSAGSAREPGESLTPGPIRKK